MSVLFTEGFFHQLFGVLDHADGGNGIRAQVGIDDQRLVFIVADHANALSALHFQNIVLELGPELRVGDVVNEPGERAGVSDRQPAPLRAQVGMIVRAVKKVRNAVLFGNHAEKTAHFNLRMLVNR